MFASIARKRGRIVVPAECKLEFRNRLAQANIAAKSLFPGLDGITAWLCEYYRPKVEVGAVPVEVAPQIIDSIPALRAGDMRAAAPFGGPRSVGGVDGAS